MEEQLRKDILFAIREMEDSINIASRRAGWGYPVAQALIPGRNALFAIAEKLLKDKGPIAVLDFLDGRSDGT